MPHGYRTLGARGADGMPGKYNQKKIGFTLFDMENDPYETTNVLDKHPVIAEKMKSYTENHRKKFYSKS